MKELYRSFGTVTLESYSQKDKKTGVCVGKPQVRTIAGSERFALDGNGQIMFDVDGVTAIRYRGEA